MIYLSTYPFQLSGCNLPQSPPHRITVALCRRLVVKAWEDSINFSWNTSCHHQMMIMSKNDYFSPITCLIEQKMALAVDDEDQVPKPWTDTGLEKSMERRTHFYCCSL